MKAILVFIDGTICDTRPRHALGVRSAAFYHPDAIAADLPVTGSVETLRKLSQRYQIVYLGARPGYTTSATLAWLEERGFPSAPVFLADTLEERLEIVDRLHGEFDFLAGIADRWDDNLLHSRLDCISIILEEYSGDWGTVCARIEAAHRNLKIQENRTFLRGKIEGLARVCPLLDAHYGDEMWQVWMDAVMGLAESSREALRQEYAQEYKKHRLSPDDLRCAAWLDDYQREKEWENNPAYGLQDFELVEATQHRYVHKVTRCEYAELWKAHNRPDIGYHIHCATDRAWWDRPAWNPKVRFEQPKTIMQGDEFCLFVQMLPEDNSFVNPLTRNES